MNEALVGTRVEFQEAFTVEGKHLDVCGARISRGGSSSQAWMLRRREEEEVVEARDWQRDVRWSEEEETLGRQKQEQ